MAAPESDEEYDKRRRDKFRRERNDVRTKEDWEDRSEQYNRNVRSNPNNAYNNNNKTRGENYRNIPASGGGGDFEGSGGATKRRRYEEYSPPTHYNNNNNKKGRRPPTDWDESSSAVGGGAYYGPPGAYWGPPPPLGAEYPPPGHLAGHPLPPGAMSYRAGYSHDDNHLMSFKQYLLEQEDTIEPEEAVRRYKNYTLEFQRHAISLFFNAHKGEEWFKNKYHPDEREKFKQEKEDKVKLRLAIFMDFYESGLVDKIILNQYHIPDIVKFMDSVIVRLEGGTDADVKALDSESYGVSSLGGGNQLSSEGVAMATGTNQKDANNEKKAVSSRKSKEKKPNTSINDENNNGGIADEKMEAKNDENENGISPKRPDLVDNDDDMEDIGDLEDSFSGHVTSEVGITMATSGGQQNGDMPDSSLANNNNNNNNGPDDEEKLDFEIEEHEMHDNKEKDKPPAKRHGSSRSSSCSSFHSSSSSSDSTSSKRSHGSSRHHNNKQTDSDMVLLHKTTSIFLRNLPPAITKAEIENLCKDYKGYLRVALADPLPERKFYRRGWVTFDSRANVKEICATLGTMKVRECEMGPIVNRDITRRVRLINGLVIHHAILLRDICLSLHVMHVLDRKYNLWTTPFNEENESTKKSSDDVVNSNGGIILQSADAEPATEPEKDKGEVLTTVSNNSNNVAPLSVQARYRKELTQAQNTEKLIKDDLEKDQTLLRTLLLFDENQPQEDIKNTRDEESIIDKLCRELNITNPIIKALITKLKQYQDHRINQKNEIRAVSPTSDVEEGEMVGDKPGSSLGENHTYKDLSTITDNVNDETTGDKKFDRLNNDETIINGNLCNVDPRTLGTLISIEKDDALAKVLDVLILYLRVVHSLDYYSVSEYPNEDDMPNKCGIMHCRGALTQNRVLNREIYDWMKSFEKKIGNFISLHNAQITLEDARVLGLRDYDTEVEKFIKDNIQELSKDKWLCPLSGKKFKGPDFVRKHIINKHAEKLENVKVEVDYFNNYLLDPRRPHVQDGNVPSSGGATPAVLPSAVTGGPNAPSAVTSGAQGKGGARTAVFANGAVSGPHHPPPPYYGSGPYSAGDMGGVGKGTADMYHTPPVYGSGAGVRGFGHSGYERNMYMKRKGFGSQREIVTYRDLDAPEEPEQFF